MIPRGAVQDLLARARAADAAGLCVLPPKADGSKQPDAASWTRYQHQRSTPEEIARWYAPGRRTGIGYVCGAVSGHLELLEFDDLPAYDRFLVLAGEAGLGDLVAKVAAGYEEVTPGGGVHWLYRLAGGGARTTALARRPGVDAAGRPRSFPLIETKGEGGYVVVAPSYGKTHPTGDPYVLRSGGVETIATLTEAERDTLWSLARTFDETAEATGDPRTTDPFAATASAGAWLVRPGDDFAANISWAAILGPHGWEVAREVGDETRWRRPGGHPGGWGACTNHEGSDRLRVFTTAAEPLKPDTGYSKFAAYAALNHGGDYTAAARALESEGYGQRRVTVGGATPGAVGTAAPRPPEGVPRPDPDNPPPPFPVDVFPEEVRRFLLEGAAALGVPVDMVAVPLLGFAAGAIGNSRAILVKRSWVERPNLWLAVVGEPGSGKSPALRLAQEPVARLQRAAYEAWKHELEEWAEAAAEARREKEEPPPKPALAHYFTTDATLEALAAMLDGSAGVAVVRDELVGWVRSHDAYRKGGDRQSFLSLWAGAALKVDRKTSGTVYVEHPCVPVVGGVQPELLPELAEEAHRRDGFVDRIDMVWPVALPQRWTEETVDEARVQAVADLFGKLRAAPPREGEGACVAALDDGGRAVFARWYDENAAVVRSAAGLAAGYAAKYPGKLARIALVLAALRHPDEPRRAVDAATVRDAVEVVEYLRGHLPTVLPAFTTAAVDTGGAGVDARVARVLANAGGDWVARRALHDGLGRNVAAAALDAALGQLEADGAVERRTVETGARPREEARWVAGLPGRANEQTSKWGEDHEEDGGEDDGRATDGKCSFVRLFDRGEPSDEEATDDGYAEEVEDDRTEDSWETWEEAV